MSYLLEMQRIRAGRWEALLLGPDAAGLAVSHLERSLPGLVAVADGLGRWRLSLPIPPEVLNDGVQTFLLTDAPSGEVLAHFSIIAGVPLEDDLRTEIDLLRAELDMLKRAFRRHCLESGS
ncbi:MAG: hypothetical protein Q8J98_10560 [Phaeovulum sp.]|uniref:hypothetical protein n=1 Tax=Phaeovulum sp. TaxID=2934796 RepID=UPI0027305089|nr:hypothetical protein [Phaeovulum sp.]MDP2063527.1 hypothetical protein [Phaeovulum sp.]